MNVQPKPATRLMPGRPGAPALHAQPRGRIPVVANVVANAPAWPIAFEVEPWRP